MLGWKKKASKSCNIYNLPGVLLFFFLTILVKREKWKLLSFLLKGGARVKKKVESFESGKKKKGEKKADTTKNGANFSALSASKILRYNLYFSPGSDHSFPENERPFELLLGRGNIGCKKRSSLFLRFHESLCCRFRLLWLFPCLGGKKRFPGNVVRGRFVPIRATSQLTCRFHFGLVSYLFSL